MAADTPFRIGNLVLTEQEVLRRKAFLEIGPGDEEALRGAHPHLLPRVPEIVEELYRFLLSQEHTRRLLTPPGVLDRLRQLQTRHFIELTSGPYDLPYFERRLRVGLTHERIGLGLEWYMGAYRKYQAAAVRVLQEAMAGEPRRLTRALDSLGKIYFLDMTLAIDAYIQSAQEELSRRAAALEKANEDLRKLDSAKRHLTGAIVHDLQNPLAGIIAFLQVLDTRPEGLREAERRSLREALARCGDLSSLITDVLQMDRAEEGRLELYLENIDLAEIARGAVEAFSIVAEQGRRALRFREAGAPVMVRTDQSVLRRIVYNLVRNALQHTPAGTRVELVVRAGPPWNLSVEDNGPGVPLELQPYLFEPGALRRSGHHVETGIGLVFCKRAAEALGMDLQLTSPPGSGACFTISSHPPDAAPG